MFPCSPEIFLNFPLFSMTLFPCSPEPLGGPKYNLQLITDIWTMVMACFGDVRGLNEKQTKHFVFKYSATIHLYTK